jgi:hypothetical protein
LAVTVTWNAFLGYGLFKIVALVF